jgi:hypothetical protein
MVESLLVVKEAHRREPRVESMSYRARATFVVLSSLV